MAVIYRHIKKNDSEVFYIGVGKTKKRAYSKYGRSRHWKNIVEKYGYEVEVLKTDLTYEEARELEVILIDYYGRKDLDKGSLCNLTNGGDGTWGYRLSEETKNKLSKIHKGKSYRDYSKLSEKTKKLIGNSNSKEVYRYSKQDNFIDKFKSITEASSNTGVTLSNIGLVATGKRKTAGGYIWKYNKE